MSHNAEKDVTFWCRLFGHRWEQALVDGWWRFRCRRCARVDGYCGQSEPTDLACCRIAVNCLAEHDRTEEHLRGAIEAAIDSLTRWNVNGISLVVAANIRHLRRALDGDS